MLSLQTAAPYEEPKESAPLSGVGYDEFQQIRFKPTNALWADGGGSFPKYLLDLSR